MDGVFLFADLCHVVSTHVVAVITGRDHLHHMEWVSHANESPLPVEIDYRER